MDLSKGFVLDQDGKAFFAALTALSISAFELMHKSKIFLLFAGLIERSVCLDEDLVHPPLIKLWLGFGKLLIHFKTSLSSSGAGPYLMFLKFLIILFIL